MSHTQIRVPYTAYEDSTNIRSPSGRYDDQLVYAAGTGNYACWIAHSQPGLSSNAKFGTEGHRNMAACKMYILIKKS